jgi:hypothetical protein
MQKYALTLQDVLQPYAQATGLVPGLLPKGMTGTLPATVIHSLLGAALGRYAAAPLAMWMNPDLDEKRVRNTFTLGGAAALGLPAWYLSSRAGIPDGKPDPAPLAARAPVGGMAKDPTEQPLLESLRHQEQQTLGRGESQNADYLRGRQQALVGEKQGSFGITGLPQYGSGFAQPSIPYATATDTLRTAVASGTLSPTDYASMHSTLTRANQFRESGLISPRSVMSAGVAGGLGYVAGRALGAVAGALLGLPAGQQKTLAKGVGLGNMAFDLLGRLAP